MSHMSKTHCEISFWHKATYFKSPVYQASCFLVNVMKCALTSKQHLCNIAMAWRPVDTWSDPMPQNSFAGIAQPLHLSPIWSCNKSVWETKHLTINLESIHPFESESKEHQQIIVRLFSEQKFPKISSPSFPWRGQGWWMFLCTNPYPWAHGSGKEHHNNVAATIRYCCCCCWWW